MKKAVFLIVILFLGITAITAQIKKHRWDSEFCTFEGTYNARNYTAAQLKNTLRLWATQDFDLDDMKATAFKIEDIPDLKTVEYLEADFRRKTDALQKLDIVKTPYWTEFKKRKLKSLEQQLALARNAVLAYTKPAELKKLTFADKCVGKFADPLIAGGDDLLNIWRAVNEDSRRKNADPERLRREFEAQSASSERIKYAQVEVITFGWWNCVNEFIDRGDDYGVMEKNYRKLFTKIKEINCDEP
jgi:hypothetical protein